MIAIPINIFKEKKESWSEGQIDPVCCIKLKNIRRF